MEWLRWWHGTVTDPKFQWVARKSGQNVASVIAIWAALMETASMQRDATQCNADATTVQRNATRGDVSSFNCNDFDVLLGLDDGSVDAVVRAMEDRGLIIDGRLASWDKRQPKREDSGNTSTGAASSTDRSRKHREEKKRNATQCNDMQRDATQCNAPERDTDTEYKSTLSPCADDVPADDLRLPARQTQRPASQMIVMTADWQPDMTHLSAHLFRKGMPQPPPEKLESILTDLRLKYAGQSRTMGDWIVCVTNWLTNEKKIDERDAKRNQERSGHGGRGGSLVDEVRRANGLDEPDANEFNWPVAERA